MNQPVQAWLTGTALATAGLLFLWTGKDAGTVGLLTGDPVIGLKIVQPFDFVEAIDASPFAFSDDSSSFFARIDIFYLVIGFALLVGCHGLATRQRVDNTVYQFHALLVLAILTLVGTQMVAASFVDGCFWLGLCYLIVFDKIRGVPNRVLTRIIWYGLAFGLLMTWATISPVVWGGVIALMFYQMTIRLADVVTVGLLVSGVLSISWIARPTLISLNLVEWVQWSSQNLDFWMSGQPLVAALFVISLAVAAIGFQSAARWPLFESTVVFVLALLAIIWPTALTLYLIGWLVWVPPFWHISQPNGPQTEIARCFRLFNLVIRRWKNELSTASLVIIVVLFFSATENRFGSTTSNVPVELSNGDQRGEGSLELLVPAESFDRTAAESDYEFGDPIWK